MTDPYALWLPAGAVALYVADSAHLLYGNELLFERRGSGYRVHAGLAFLVAGRRPFLPSPLRPTAALYLARWPDAPGADSTDPGTLARFERGVRVLKPLVAALWLLLVLVLPAVALLQGAGAALLGVFAAFYALVIAALVVVYLRRAVLGLSARRFAALGADVLLCAPFAVNLLRKLSLGQPAGGDAIDFIARHLDAPARTRAVALIRAELERGLALEEPGSARHAALLGTRRRLEALPP